MKIPVVLSVIHVFVRPDATLQIDVDGEAYGAERTLVRGDLRSVIDEISTHLGAAVRVELRESDGTTYTDIHTPLELPRSAHREPGLEQTTGAVTGAGFVPGETVVLAYVVSRQAADASGKAVITLPPALLSTTRDELVLLGLNSLSIAAIGLRE